MTEINKVIFYGGALLAAFFYVTTLIMVFVYRLPHKIMVLIRMNKRSKFKRINNYITELQVIQFSHYRGLRWYEKIICRLLKTVEIAVESEKSETSKLFENDENWTIK